MRASYDSLFLKVKDILQRSPFSGHVFVFTNKRRTSIKALYYDGTGLVILSKRLESGTFMRINPAYKKQISLTQAEFLLFFEGANLEKRFVESPVSPRKE
jgi:transposase